MKIDDVALIDLDGTLCDYDGAMQASMNELASPGEPFELTGYGQEHPPHIWNRMKLIKSKGDWWENLPKFQLGFDVLEILDELEFYQSILTQGPKENPIAWSHKVRWCMKNVPQIDITITRNKGLVYGKVLMDDFPDYVDNWLEHRPRGLVIMPAQKWNEKYKRKNVIRYDGTNLEQVREALIKAKNRKPSEDIQYN